MSVTIEQIDLLRKRANVGYKEAKEALEKCNGDVVEALSYLEEQNKIKPEQEPFKSSTFVRKVKNLISKANKIRLVISKDEKTILNLPSTLAVAFVVFAMPVVIVSLIITLVTGCKIRFHKENGENCSINNKIDKVTNVVTSVKNKITEEFNNA
ncbi:DUF4342 domain-containing protein [Clostridium sp. WILCCON 0269]|uniref:DUF4342 domain-containing protein n=1 Tax=Candidatus Clostridium eludens TaxID=3381663 RepID=A0ABW8SN21_9CLOT